MNNARPPCGRRPCSWMVRVIWLLTLAWPLTLAADQAQYIYDELGRLIGVTDGQGKSATYTYDAVGNLLRIARARVTAPVIATRVPGSAALNTTPTLMLTGTGLWPASVTMANPAIRATVEAGTPTSLSVRLTIPPVTTLGPTRVTVRALGGVVTTTLTIVDPLTTVQGRVVDPEGKAVAGAKMTIAGVVVGVTAPDGTFRFSGIATVSGSLQVKASGRVEGFPVVGRSAVVSPVHKGVTDVGRIALPRPRQVRAVAVNDAELTLNVINPLTLAIEARVRLPTTASSRPRTVVVSGDGATALVPVGYETGEKQKLIFVDLRPTPPVVMTVLTLPFSGGIGGIEGVTLGCPRPELAFVSGYRSGFRAISVKMATQTIISELTTEIRGRLVLVPPAGVHILGRTRFNAFQLLSVDAGGRLFDTGTTLTKSGLGSSGLVISPRGGLGLIPTLGAYIEEPVPTYVEVVAIGAGPTVTLRHRVPFPKPTSFMPHSLTFNSAGTKAYVLVEGTDLARLDIDRQHVVTDSGLRVPDVWDGEDSMAFRGRTHAIAVLDGTQQVLVRKEGVVTVIDQSTHTIKGTIPLPGSGSIATVGMECL